MGWRDSELATQSKSKKKKEISFQIGSIQKLGFEVERF